MTKRNNCSDDDDDAYTLLVLIASMVKWRAPLQ